MKKITLSSLFFICCSLFISCLDHDDPTLSPIDTNQVKIETVVTDLPDLTWYNTSEEITINVGDVKMSAPDGVILKSISLYASNGSSKILIDEKPYSGETLVYKVPLTQLEGRINFSLIGNLIKKDCRDAEIIIADNIQKIVFSESPKFECTGKLSFLVKSVSTSGEEYLKYFEVASSDHFTIPVSQDELYWKPSDGTASELEISLGSGALAWSPNTTFESKILKTAIGNSTGDEAILKITIPNNPGSLNALNLHLYVETSYFGTWENISIEPYNLLSVFDIIETED